MRGSSVERESAAQCCAGGAAWLRADDKKPCVPCVYLGELRRDLRFVENHGQRRSYMRRRLVFGLLPGRIGDIAIGQTVRVTRSGDGRVANAIVILRG